MLKYSDERNSKPRWGNMQYCTKCGNVIEEGVEYCSRCGQHVKKGQTAGGEERATPAVPQSTGAGGAAIALGIVGLLVGFLFIPLVGIILGIVAIALGASASGQGDRNGSAGVILGVLSLILSIVVWIIGLMFILSF
jgi:hypothetical protein